MENFFHKSAMKFLLPEQVYSPVWRWLFNPLCFRVLEKNLFRGRIGT